MIKSRLFSTMNTVAKAIVKVEIFPLGEKYDGEIVTIEFKNGSKKFINTATNVISNSARKAYTKKETSCKLQNNRLSTVLYLDEYKNGTRLQLGTLLGLAKDFYYKKQPSSYVGYEINHIDRTGNQRIYGYINNKLYNLETCDKSSNEIHWMCIKRVQKELGMHIAFSANNEEYLNNFQYLSTEKLRTIIENSIDFLDNQGTIYLK